MTEDPSALRTFMVAGPEVSRLATEYEIVSGAKDANEKVRHHEQTARAQQQVVAKLESCMVSCRKWEILFKKKLLICLLLTQI